MLAIIIVALYCSVALFEELVGFVVVCACYFMGGGKLVCLYECVPWVVFWGDGRLWRFVVVYIP